MFTRTQKEDLMCIINETVCSLLKNENFIVPLAEKVSANLKSIIEEQSKIINKLEMDLNEAIRENKYLNHRLNLVEKPVIKSTLRIHGLEEEQKENTEEVVMKLFNNVLKVNISPNCINDAYRIGTINQNNTVKNLPTKNSKKQARTIVVRFRSVRERQQILINRKLLRSTGIRIYEELSTNTLKLFQKCMKKFPRQDLWTFGDKVFVKIDGIKRILKDEDVID